MPSTFEPLFATTGFTLGEHAINGFFAVSGYRWPVQQALVQLAPAAGALSLLAPSLAITLGVAALSWFFVERPALSLKVRWGDTPRGNGSAAW